MHIGLMTYTPQFRIAKEFNLKLTLDHVTEGYLMLDELKREKYPCIVGPNLTMRSKIELKNLSFENAGILSKNGIMVALMTDHPVIPIQYLILCAALSVKEGMEEYEALKAITINPATILGIDDRVGSIDSTFYPGVTPLDLHCPSRLYIGLSV